MGLESASMRRSCNFIVHASGGGASEQQGQRRRPDMEASPSSGGACRGLTVRPGSPALTRDAADLMQTCSRSVRNRTILQLS